MSLFDLLIPQLKVLSDDGIEGIIDLANVGSRRKRRPPSEARPNDLLTLNCPTAAIRRVVERLAERFAGHDDVPGLLLFEGLKGSGKSHLLLLVYHLFANHTAAQNWQMVVRRVRSVQSAHAISPIRFLGYPRPRRLRPALATTRLLWRLTMQTTAEGDAYEDAPG
jgi:predicted alpha/beta-fold hydrolase